MIKGLKNIFQQQQKCNFKNIYAFSQIDPIKSRRQQVLVKPFSVPGDNMVLSLSPIKGKYGTKSDYITVLKNGCMLIELIPKQQIQDKYQMDWKNKKVYALSVAQIGNILGITDQQLATQDINVEMQYSMQNSAQKTLQIQKSQLDDKMNFQLTYNENNEQNMFQIDISQQDFIVIRELCRFSLPYLLGWQALESYEYAEKDSRDERI